MRLCYGLPTGCRIPGILLLCELYFLISVAILLGPLQINRVAVPTVIWITLFILQPCSGVVAQTWMHYGGDEGGSRF